MLALEALTRRSEDLARSHAAMEEFASIASHDLQEPLRGVTGCIQLLQKNYQGKLDARADEFIRHSVVNIERMQALILALLDYTRIDRRGAEFGSVDCGIVLRETLSNLSVSIEESAARITAEDLPVIIGDRHQMTQLFQNLIGNAIKFRGAETPDIVISARPGGDGCAAWTFTVRDNGIGIESQHASRIFGVFQRLHARGKYPGTGIGLAICRRIVERHGGRIRVESHASRGAAFIFTLANPECQESTP
jgi:light-regulated signal transduction histidine kinase (bacteriophytochrome)